MEEMNKNTAENMDDLHTEPEIKEFMHKPDAGKNAGLFRQLIQGERKVKVQPWMWAAGFAVVLLAVILCGILLCKAPAVTVIIVSILEALLAICLCQSPIWLHGLVVVVNVVLGIIFHVTIFMILACLVYLAGILVIHVLAR